MWLKLRTDDGIEGLGVTYFGGALTRSLRHAVDELGALAIGCIAAAVAGQVEFGIPCVVGGVATSAALRIWDGPK